MTIARGAQAGDITVDIRVLNPVLPERGIKPVFPEQLKGLITAALDQPDAEARMRGIEVVGRSYEAGHKPMAALGDRLVTMAADSKEHRLVRLQAVRSLRRMKYASGASQLLAVIDASPQMTLQIDAALAEWKHLPALKTWRQRATNRDADLGLRISALEALRTVGDKQAAESLRALASDRGAAPRLRIAAADAVAAIAPSGNVSAAAGLAKGSMFDRLVAMRLIEKAGDNKGAIAVAVALVQDRHAAVRGEAAEWLGLHAPKAMLPQAAMLAERGDSKERRWAIASWLASGQPDDVAPIVALLDDPSPWVRSEARKAMVKLHQSDPAVAQTVKKALRAVLAGDAWRANEQAILLAARIDDRDAASIIQGKLDHSRHEVRLAAVIAIREMNVASTLPPLLSRASRVAGMIAIPEQGPRNSERQAMSPEQVRSLDKELTAALQTLGWRKHMEALSLLNTIAKKGSGHGEDTRASAVWALGFLGTQMDDRERKQVARFLNGRMNDMSIQNPEMGEVRRMAAVSLGRVKDEGALSRLRRYADIELGGDQDGLAAPSRWAIEQITGEEQPPIPPRESLWRDSFIQPLRNR